MSWPDPVPACSREEWAEMTDGHAWPGPPSSSPPRPLPWEGAPLPWVERGTNGEVEYVVVSDEIVAGTEVDTVLGFIPSGPPEEVDDSSASSEQVS